MRYQGMVVEWNGSRGYGFVRTHGEDRRIFAHASAFARHVQPVVGDVVTYIVERDDKGRPRVAAAELAISKSRVASRRRPHHATAQRAPWWPAVGALAIVAALAVLAWHHTGNDSPDEVRAGQEPDPARAVSLTRAATKSRFTCAGKRSCPQMTSCEEATFYLRQCPGTLQDGDGDGIPCEDQWCGH